MTGNREDAEENEQSGSANRTPENTRFLLDVMCGRLARYLRFCGYDAAYALDRDVESDDRILSIAREEDRTLITRDVELAERAEDAILVSARDVTDQLEELAKAGVEITMAETPRRCGRCNGRLHRCSTDEQLEHVPDDRPIWRCRDCGHRFWRGSHWNRVAEQLESVGDGSETER